MGLEAWFSQNWFECLSIALVLVGLFFTADSLRAGNETARIANLLTITANHREIWTVFLKDKQLSRVLSPAADTRKQPVTEAERIFVVMVVLHINSVYFATRDELMIKLEGWRRDIAGLFSLPIPREVWEQIKVLQNDDFAAFLDSCRNWK